MNGREKCKDGLVQGWNTALTIAVLIPALILVATPSLLLAEQLGPTDADPNAFIPDPSAVTGNEMRVGPGAVGSMAADAICIPVVQNCGCGMVLTPKGCIAWPNKFLCPCFDVTFGFKTPGICVANNICLGLGTVGLTGAAIGIGKGIVGKILGGNESSGSNVPAGGMSLAGGSKVGCSGTPYISTTPSTNPCAVYIPTGATASSTLNLSGLSQSPSVSSVLLNTLNNKSGTAGTPSVSDTLLKTDTSGAGTLPPMAGSASQTGYSSANNSIWNTFFGGGGGTSLSNAGTGLMNIISGNTNNTSPPNVSTLLGNYGTNTGTRSNTPANAPAISQKPTGVQSGTWGDIQADAFGVTITAGAQYADTRTGVGGFYGYDAVRNVQPQALAGQLCASRPWGTSSAITVIPPTFFDSICTARGYKVGFAASAPSSSFSTSSASAMAGTANKNSGTADSQTSTIKTTDATSTKTSLPAGRPQVLPQPAGPVYVAPVPSVTISALPARVRIASRSTIYWSAKGVTVCTVTSPDGSFSGNTLSGAASTVALYVNTVFTISCETSDGSIVTKSVTVETSS
ncbi:MAG: hypothetical protein Q7S08_01100 [bacterium]|nr:hypothetical protein [bacterium]